MEDLFRGKSPDRQKLLGFGFREEDGALVYSEEIAGGFLVTVTVTDAVRTRTLDCGTGEVYSLHLVDGAGGAFVGEIRAAYTALLTRVAACFSPDAFRSETARTLLGFAREKFGSAPEYLWKKFPEDAVLRRENGKWYAVLMAVPAEKIGLEGGRLEIVDVRADPAEIARLVDGQRYFAGYHMNKKHWLTMSLNGRVPAEEICARLEESYFLAE